MKRQPRTCACRLARNDSTSHPLAYLRIDEAGKFVTVMLQTGTSFSRARHRREVLALEGIGDRLGQTVRLHVLSSAAVYLVVLTVWLHAYIGPLIAYTGFGPRKFDPYLWAVAIGLALLPVAFTPENRDRPTSAMFWMLYFVGLGPGIVVPTVLGRASTSTVLTQSISFSMVGILVGQHYRRPRFRPERSSQFSRPLRVENLGLPARRARRLASACLVASLGMTATMIAINPSAFTHVLSLDQVYARRFEARNLAGAFPGYSYLLSWVQLVVNPLLVVLGRLSRRPLMVVVGVSGYGAVYLYSGQRSALSALALLGLWLRFYRRNTGSSMGRTVAGGLVVAIVSSYILDRIAGQPLLPTSVLMRLIEVPAEIATRYFSFFSTHRRALFTDGLIGNVIGSHRYPETVPFLIGRLFYQPGTSANTGIFSDGYANAGIPGIFIVVMLFIVILRQLDRLAFGLPLPIVGPLLAIRAGDFINSPLPTDFLTHGLWLTFLVLLVLRPSRRQQGGAPPQVTMPPPSPPDTRSLKHRLAEHK
jgi:hypothetical protein